MNLQHAPSFAKESNKDRVQAEHLLYEHVKSLRVSFIKCLLLIGKKQLNNWILLQKELFQCNCIMKSDYENGITSFHVL